MSSNRIQNIEYVKHESRYTGHERTIRKIAPGTLWEVNIKSIVSQGPNVSGYISLARKGTIFVFDSYRKQQRTVRESSPRFSIRLLEPTTQSYWWLRCSKKEFFHWFNPFWNSPQEIPEDYKPNFGYGDPRNYLRLGDYYGRSDSIINLGRFSVGSLMKSTAKGHLRLFSEITTRIGGEENAEVALQLTGIYIPKNAIFTLVDIEVRKTFVSVYMNNRDTICLKIMYDNSIYWIPVQSNEWCSIENLTDDSYKQDFPYNQYPELFT